ncbi:MAG: PASTA domain-containing protein [Nocardioides sp.]
MDPADYLDARWHALLRTAVDLGVPEDEAPVVVRRVLDAHRRRIRRADDPDPLVRAALREAVLGAPPHAARRRRLGLAVLGAALAGLVALGVVMVLTRTAEPDPDRLGSDQVPSLFGYDGDTARAALEDRGLTVTLEPFRACEILDRVVASDPPTGTVVERGDPVTVFTALPADVACLADYTDREWAWQLVDFANGRGPAPRFADRVSVHPAHGPRVVLDRAAARERASWDATGVFDGLRSASEQVRLVSEEPVAYAVPEIRIIPASDKARGCGAPGPPTAGDGTVAGDAFAVLIRPPDRAGCGVRVDVVRDGAEIVAVAPYAAPES